MYMCVYNPHSGLVQAKLLEPLILANTNAGQSRRIGAGLRALGALVGLGSILHTSMLLYGGLPPSLVLLEKRPKEREREREREKDRERRGEGQRDKGRE